MNKDDDAGSKAQEESEDADDDADEATETTGGGLAAAALHKLAAAQNESDEAEPEDKAVSHTKKQLAVAAERREHLKRKLSKNAKQTAVEGAAASRAREKSQQIAKIEALHNDEDDDSVEDGAGAKAKKVIRAEK